MGHESETDAALRLDTDVHSRSGSLLVLKILALGVVHVLVHP